MLQKKLKEKNEDNNVTCLSVKQNFAIFVTNRILKLLSGQTALFTNYIKRKEFAEYAFYGLTIVKIYTYIFAFIYFFFHCCWKKK